MIIPIIYKYKSYPYCEKADRYSKALGIAFSWVGWFSWCLLYSCVMLAIIALFNVQTNITYIILAIAMVPFVFALLKLKKHISIKIEKIALEEIKLIEKNAEFRKELARNFKNQFGNRR